MSLLLLGLGLLAHFLLPLLLETLASCGLILLLLALDLAIDGILVLKFDPMG